MIHLFRSLVMLALWAGLVLPAAARAEESAENTSAERALSSRVGELELGDLPVRPVPLAVKRDARCLQITARS